MKQMAWLSLGSNVNREANLCAGLDALLEAFGNLLVSSVYESAAVGFDGAPFLNLAAGMETTLGVTDITTRLRTIEDRHGRDRGQPRFSDRTLDIDLLLLGNLAGEFSGVRLPRPETTEQAFVLGPLTEIAPNLSIPPSNQTLASLWSGFGRSGLRTVPLHWRGQDLSDHPGPKAFSLD